MNFKYNTIGNNTPEVREWLEGIGYRAHRDSKKSDKWLVTSSDGFFCSIKSLEQVINTSKEKKIDCTENLLFFKALTAVRGNNDYMQWFRDGESWYKCYTDTFIGYTFIDNTLRCSYHKASEEELANQFSGFHHKLDV